MGIHVGELTGDTESFGQAEISKSNIIVTTPEKWDSMTRKWLVKKVFQPFTIIDLELILTFPPYFLLSRTIQYPSPKKRLDHFSLMSSIRLFLIDEVHVLNEPKRGATLEVVVSRMKTMGKRNKDSSSFSNSVRIIALSATVPNIGDLGEWLGDSNHSALTK